VNNKGKQFFIELKKLLEKYDVSISAFSKIENVNSSILFNEPYLIIYLGGNKLKAGSLNKNMDIDKILTQGIKL